MASSQSLILISKCTIFPDQKSILSDLKLSVSDIPMLSCHYIQKDGLFTRPPVPIDSLIFLLQCCLYPTLSLFPPLAEHLKTDTSGYVYITCNNAGVDFIHASAIRIHVRDILSPTDVPNCVKEFFTFDRTVSYDGHFKPILAVQVTELADGIFIGCALNHTITDGTSFWNFFNTSAEFCGTGARNISRVPDFHNESMLISPTVLRVPKVDPSRNGAIDRVKLMGKQSDDPLKFIDGKIMPLKWLRNAVLNTEMLYANPIVEISSFQSLCALLWKTSILKYASASEVLSRDLRWCAEQPNKNVKAHDNATVRRCVEDWEQDPRCFLLGNFDGAMITMGSSPRFPMYNNDFEWGRPVAVRSRRANKFDGWILAFLGREGGGTIDLEVVLVPETMAGLELNLEFMYYVSGY
ncbi:unnamed protein product [Ilex paraguariensis]|uniref:Uncharacterized protein n=1 Tax=Ilex paraguariensis TaxID=185542 RepID=A0ABC8QSN3_9AQUA